MSATPTLYRHYLAADLAKQRVEKLGYRLGDITLDDSPLLNEYEGLDGIPNYMRWPRVRCVVSGFENTYTLDQKNPGMLTQDELELTVQEEREAAALALAAYPGAAIFRVGGNAYVYFEVFDGDHKIGVNLDLGRALCERVQVGTKTVTRPKDQELADRIMDGLEKETVEEPVFEWRCNDAGNGLKGI